jgi:ELWxxDGT repeat protein
MDDFPRAGARYLFRALTPILVASLAVIGPASAATRVAMVKNIRPGANSSKPQDLTRFARRAFFFARDGRRGRELWKSNGTAVGTKPVTRLSPRNGIAPTRPARVRHSLFFSADDGTHGMELWKTDGTRRGTKLVDDIAPGSAGSSPLALTKVGTDLFFAANDGDGEELWKSDGTVAGTKRLMLITHKDDRPRGPWDLTAADGQLFFTADDRLHGDELWRSDGTPRGTRMVKDIRPGPAGSGPGPASGKVEFRGELFFAAGGNSTGYGLWRSDGTEAGTQLVSSAAFDPFGLTPVGGRLFFSARDARGTELWASRGSTAGTGLVKDIDPGVDPDGLRNSSFPIDLTSFRGALFFSACDSTGDGCGLWKSDGTEAGTQPVKPFTGTESVIFAPFMPVRGALFFLTNRPHDQGLWESDGTEAGTTSVRHLPLIVGVSVYTPIRANGRLFFVASDGSHGLELWKAVP